MDPSQYFLAPRKSLWIDRLQALLEVLVLAGLLSSAIAYLPFALSGISHEALIGRARVIALFVLLEACITVALLMLILRAHGESLRYLGWRRGCLRADVLIGLLVVPVLFLMSGLVSLFFRSFLPRYYSEQNLLLETIRSPGDLVLFIISALFAGGIKEELQRAFVLIRFREYLGGATLGLILWSTFFAYGHYLQGVQGSVVAGLFGFLFGVIYLVRGSLVAPVVAHSVYDAAALLGYWFLKASTKY
jgi:membrane protease YdiL (CAAX protease family)